MQLRGYLIRNRVRPLNLVIKRNVDNSPLPNRLVFQHQFGLKVFA